MLRYTLTHSIEGSIVLQGKDSPANADSFSLSFSRSETYHSVLRSYTISDKFAGIGKTYIDAIIAKYGWNAIINVSVEMWDANFFKWFYIIENGIVNLSNWKKTEIFTEVNFEDGSFQSKVMNREENEINYYNLIDSDGNEMRDFLSSDIDITLNGVGSTSLVSCIYPELLFRRIINNISGLADRFDSSVFELYPNVGENALLMATNGKKIRGFAGLNFTTSLKDTFKSYSAIKCLGLGFEKIDGVDKVIIDKLRYFFTPLVICELQNIRNLEIIWATELLPSEITVGYSNSEKMENIYGQSEYNNKVIYSTPLNQFKKKMSILSQYRADGTTIENLRVLGITADASNLDNENFIIDCFKDELENVVSRKLEGLKTTPSGVYADFPLYTNCLLTPARMLKNWGDYFGAGLIFDRDKYLQIQKTETTTNIVTESITDLYPIEDGKDVLIYEICDPFLTGRIIKFDATFGALEISLINEAPNGLIKFYNYVDKIYNFAYIKDIQINPVDATHSFEGYEAIYTASNENDYLLLDEQGLPILTEDGNFIKLETSAMASTKITQFENLASIPDEAYYVVAYNGKNYNQKGSQLKAALAVDIEGMLSALLQPDTEGIIIVGDFTVNTTYLIQYQLKRGERYRSGMFTLIAYADASAADITESATLTIPNTFGETAGITSITADVYQTSVRLKILTDNSDTDISELKYLITKI